MSRKELFSRTRGRLLPTLFLTYFLFLTLAIIVTIGFLINQGFPNVSRENSFILVGVCPSVLILGIIWNWKYSLDILFKSTEIFSGHVILHLFVREFPEILWVWGSSRSSHLLWRKRKEAPRASRSWDALGASHLLLGGIFFIYTRFQNLFPDPLVTPPAEPAVYILPVSIRSRQVPPRRSGTQNPEYAVDKLPGIMSITSSCPFFTDGV